MVKYFKNFKISKKLWVGFGIVLGLMFFSVVISFVNLNTMGRQINQYSEKTVPNTNTLWEMRRNLVSIQRYMLIALTEEDLDEINTNLTTVGTEAKEVLALMTTLTDNADVDDAKLNELSQLITSMGPIRQEISELLALGETAANAQAFALFKDEYKPLIDQASVIMDEFGAQFDQDAKQQAVAAKNAERFSYIILISVALLSLAISIYIIGVIRKAISHPIDEIQHAAEKLAAGDLEAVITYESEDELGELAKSTGILIERLKAIISDVSFCLGAMAEGNFDINSQCEDQYVGHYTKIFEAMKGIKLTLSDALSNINEAASQVTAASDQVSASAQDLACGATDQASSIEELTATIAELTEKIQVNAANAVEVNKMSDEAKKETEQSNRYMQEMVSAMTEITGASNEIGKIISAIKDIAEQTNLLSLNAAIEAARAGEAGRGFAVVASEVGTLAKESADAVKETSDLIDKTFEAVENGTRIVNQTAESLKKVISQTALVGATIQKISEASEEQAESSEQLRQGVDTIAGVIQTNAATAEESSATSEELNAQAQMLKELVGKFILAK